jgi:hypothetical protein
MNKEFVTYEQALSLKELGFDEECIGGFTKIFPFKDKYRFYIEDLDCAIPCPTKQHLFRWFRENHNIIGLIEGGYDNGKNLFTYVIWQGSFDDWLDAYWDTYEEAENACIDKLIEILKQQDNGN